MKTQLAMTIATISEGHTDLADLLFLIAFIVGVLAVVAGIVTTGIPAKIQAILVPLILALVSLAWFVL